MFEKHLMLQKKKKTMRVYIHSEQRLYFKIKDIFVEK